MVLVNPRFAIKTCPHLTLKAELPAPLGAATADAMLSV
jgi:hypothetical protein